MCRHVKLVAVGGIGARSAGRLILLRLLVHGANGSRQHGCFRRRMLKDCGFEECGRSGSDEPWRSWLELGDASGGMRLGTSEKQMGMRLCLILGMDRYILGVRLCIGRI